MIAGVFRFVYSTLFATLLTATAPAQLVVTEALYDPLSDEDRWEWIEIRNVGSAAVDLDGYLIDRVGDRERTDLVPNILANPLVGQQTVANQTIIPAAGIAVLYNGPALGYDPERFRAAWPDMPLGTQLIGVEGWSSNRLTNRPMPSVYAPSLPAVTLGVWASEAAYRLDAEDFGTPTKPDRRLFRTDHAEATLNYDDDPPWPEASGGASLIYLSGPVREPLSWGRSNPPWGGAQTSQITYVPGPINAPEFGSPGLGPPGTSLADGLLITELMYNPASVTGAGEWEWIEVFNNGSTIDFTTTPHWLDDDDGYDLASANVTAGQIESGEYAVLFNADAATLEQMQTAWQRPGQAAINWIAVEDWPALANGGDLVGLWSDATGYAADRLVETGSIARAVVGLAYDDSDPWPTGTDGDAIRLSNLGAVAADPAAWQRARGEFADPHAYQTAQVFGPSGVIDNAGGDKGSPGIIFPDIVSPLPGDYNRDGLVNAADYTLWRDGRPLPTEIASVGVTDRADYDIWRTNFGRGVGPSTAVPEPTASLLLLMLVIPMTRRKS